MSANSYEIRLCQNPDCGLRYPLTDPESFGTRCPACLGITRAVLRRELLSNNLPLPREEKAGMRVESHLSALLDNVRSAWNVGSIFRTSDGLGLRKLYLCGITSTPDNKSVRKTSLGAEERVAWEHSLNAVEMAKKLKGEGCALVALEQDERAIPLSAFLPERSETQSRGTKHSGNPSTTDFTTASSSAQGNTVLVVGNEVTGVDPGLLDLCDHIIYIPMRGGKRSFNVEVVFAIATYTLTRD